MTGKSRTSAPTSVLSIARQIADELGVAERQVQAVIELLEEGATVPFIARYRKERTGGLDDTQLRMLAERLEYLTDLVKRRDAILDAIRQQGKMTPDLEREIMAAKTKVALEDLYAPYKQKRRTKATIAKEAGLEPLAERILANPALALSAEAKAFVSKKKGVETPEAALEGAREIIVEKIAETLDDPTIIDDHVRSRADVNQLHGVGVSEAPRGTLFHEYDVDENGVLKKVNLIIATGQNNLAMNQTVRQIADEYVRDGQLTEGILNRIEHGIRTFDPCLSCSTHAIGQMPLHVQLLDSHGAVVEEVMRE